MNNNIFLIGSGNIAWAILYQLKRINIKVSGIYSRNEKEAKVMSREFKCKLYKEIINLKQKSGFFFLCVNDSSIEEVASYFTGDNQYLIHFSGTVSLKQIEKYNKNAGVFYIFQSFTKNISVNFKNLPVFIETNNEKIKEFLINIASKLQMRIFYCNSETRSKIHIAGVISSNFINFLILIVQNYLKNNNINNKIINNLVEHTVRKALKYGAENTQTGPAIRGDKEIIKKHLQILKDNEILYRTYKFFSKEISGYFLK